MATTTFTDGSTVILAAWLNDVNTQAYTYTIVSGSWTPTLTGETTAPSVITYDAANTGTYTKIGRLVLLTGRLALASLTGGTGVASMGGLPYAATAANGDRGTFCIGFASGFSSSTTPSAMLSSVSSSAVRFYRRASADARDALSTTVAITEFSATSTVLFHGFYFTA